MFSIDQNKKHVLKLFALCILLVLILPDLVQHGMFMDGIQYACVSKNFADGKSSFWLPFLNSAWDKHHVNYFLEQPPLVYYLQSKFFILCNNGFLSERLYCLFTLILSIFFIYKIWDLIFTNDEKTREYWWLPVFIWIIIPSVSWSFKNNMHENTLSVFVLAASFFALKYIYVSKSVIYVIAVGICVFLASLSKGLPGFFPLSIFIVHYFVTKKLSLKKSIFYSGILFLIPLGIYCMVYFGNSNARISLDFYLKYRLIDRINNSPQVDNRFTILFWAFTDLLVPLMLTGILILIVKLKLFTGLLDANFKKLIFFFVLFGLTGIVPLTFTHVQRAVYFVPAMPFFAFAFAIFLVRGLDVLFEKINEKKWKLIAFLVVVFFAGIIGESIYLFGKTGRDANEQYIAKEIAEKTDQNITIGTSYAIYSKWDLQFYLLRYYNITLDAANWKNYEYKIYEKNSLTKKINGFTKMKNEMEKYDLYKKLIKIKLSGSNHSTSIPP